MKDLHPHLIISNLSGDQNGKRFLELAKKKLTAMGVLPFFTPENFSHQEILTWISDITNQEDFFLNFSFGKNTRVYFRDSDEEEMAKIFTKEISNRTEDNLENPAPIFSIAGDTSVFLSSLALHTWDIHLSTDGKNENEIVMNIMACITDLFFLKHSLVAPELRWPFRDVPSSHFAFGAIKKAKEKGVIPGYKGDILKPNGGITRGEMLYILHETGDL